MRNFVIASLLITFPFVISLYSCRTSKPHDSEAKIDLWPSHEDPQTPLTGVSYPEINASLGEEYFRDRETEHRYAQSIAAVIEGQIRERFQSGRVMRDAHPKAHGCVKASFEVLSPSSRNHRYFQGIFATPKTYNALIRFSNASSNPTKSDLEGDARGMAIKVYDVDGEVLFEQAPNNQDFIMINYPVFVVDSPHEYLDVARNAESSSILGQIDLFESLGLRGLGIVRSLRSIQIVSPLSTQYFSMVPYQVGNRAAKFSAKPCHFGQDYGSNRDDRKDYDLSIQKAAAELPSNPHHNFLRHKLYDTLRTREGCFDFMVQLRGSGMSVEESTLLWPETESKFVTVARIKIHKIDQQDLSRDNSDQLAANRSCGNQRFNPWHATVQHKPLGATNRMRKVIYEHISKVRRQMNRDRGLF